MSTINIVFHSGPQTFTVAEPITGGQVVAPAADGKIAPAAADAEVILGVAIGDAAPRQSVYGSLNAVPLPEVVGVAYAPAAVWLETEGAVEVGGDVGVAAGGKVKAHAAGAVVGKVTEVKGSRALVRLSV